MEILQYTQKLQEINKYDTINDLHIKWYYRGKLSVTFKISGISCFIEKPWRVLCTFLHKFSHQSYIKLNI